MQHEPRLLGTTGYGGGYVASLESGDLWESGDLEPVLNF